MAIPIIGQPKIGDFTLTFHITCPCGHSFLFSGKVGGHRPCGGAGCDKIYLLPVWPTASANGKDIDITLGVGRVPEK